MAHWTLYIAVTRSLTGAWEMPHPRSTPLNHPFLSVHCLPGQFNGKATNSVGLTEAHLSGESVYHHFVILQELPGVPKEKRDDDPTIAVPGYYSIDEAFRFLSPAIRWSCRKRRFSFKRVLLADLIMYRSVCVCVCVLFTLTARNEKRYAGYLNYMSLYVM
jgi:hypothetical protein